MKRLKFLVDAVALFALVVANVWNAATTLRGTDLDVADVEAMANPEGMDGDYNAWLTFETCRHYFLMSGQSRDVSAIPESGDYIITFYRTWSCILTSPTNVCVRNSNNDELVYPMRIVVWGGVPGPEEGGGPNNNNWNGYRFYW